MTQNIEKFLNDLNLDILSQYSSIIQVMSTINQGVEGMNTVQTFMMAEINSISGILYFLLQIILIAVVTTFRPFKKNRTHSLVIYLLNIVVELLSP